MNIEEACRFGMNVYDCEIWIFMKCEKYTNFEKIDELRRNDESRHDSLQMTLSS